jgi:hypothetical protein
MFFFIDIPFQGSQSLWNMRSKVKAVSYLHSGVIDATVHVTAVSLTRTVQVTVVSLIPLCKSKSDTDVPCAAKSVFLIKQWVDLFAKIFEKKFVASGVYGTAVTCISVLLTLLYNMLCRLSLRIRSLIWKGFNLCISDAGEVGWGKKQR